MNNPWNLTATSENSTEESNINEFARYTGLRTIAFILAIVGLGTIIIGLLGGFYLLTQNGSGGMFGILSIVGGLVVGLPIVALGNLINVWIDTEYNTRMILLENRKFYLQSTETK